MIGIAARHVPHAHILRIDKDHRFLIRDPLIEFAAQDHTVVPRIERDLETTRTAMRPAIVGGTYRIHHAIVRET